MPVTQNPFHSLQTFKGYLFLLWVLILGLGAYWVFHSEIPRDWKEFQIWILYWNPNPFWFIAFYVGMTSLLFPGSLLTLSAGFLFGPLWGTIYSVSAATITGSIAFLMVRSLGWQVEIPDRFRSLVKNEREIARLLLVLRLVPLIPFNVLNYTFALTQISFTVYIFISAMAMIPGGFLYSLIGSAGKLDPEYFPQMILIVFIVLGSLILFGHTQKKKLHLKSEAE